MIGGPVVVLGARHYLGRGILLQPSKDTQVQNGVLLMSQLAQMFMSNTFLKTCFVRFFWNRLSRARRCVENAFGILAKRWRVFRAPINLAPEKVEKVVLASCCLHNYLRSTSATRHIYSPADINDHEDVLSGTVVPGSWRGDLPSKSMLSVNLGGSNFYSAEAKDVRKEFESYFMSNTGAVSWQVNVL